MDYYIFVYLRERDFFRANLFFSKQYDKNGQTESDPAMTINQVRNSQVSPPSRS